MEETANNLPIYVWEGNYDTDNTESHKDETSMSEYFINRVIKPFKVETDAEEL